MTPEAAFTVAVAAGWLALVVALAWPSAHCRCCARRAGEERIGQR